MSKFKVVSYLFVVLGLLVIVGAAYVIISYASGIIGAVVDFVTTNDFTKLQQCGVTPPSEFAKLKNEFATVILPSLYLGSLLVPLVISGLMFMAGFYYHKGKLEDDSRKSEQMEREMVHKIVKKMETEKAPPPQRMAAPSPRPAARRPEPEEEEPQEEEPAEEEAGMSEEEPVEEEEPPPRPVAPAKKRK
ncbi:MAG: hypothetical protein AB1529_02320 [Candidatus Micrarchaeota archaeon]